MLLWRLSLYIFSAILSNLKKLYFFGYFLYIKSKIINISILFFIIDIYLYYFDLYIFGYPKYFGSVWVRFRFSKC